MSRFPRAWSWMASAALASAALTWTGSALAQQAPPAGQAPPAVPAGPTLPAKEVSVGILDENTMAALSSPDYRSLATVQKRGDKYVVAVNGVDGKPYDWIVRTSLGFTRDGSVSGYVVQTTDKVVAVINGQEQKPYHEILDGGIIYGPASRYLYFAKNDRKARWMPVIDGKELPMEFDTVGGISYTTDGKRMAFAAERDDKRFFVIDGQEAPAYSKVGGGTFRFSPEGSRYAYVAEKEGKLMMVIDGQEQPPYEEITPPLFSPDGKHIAYAAKLGDKRMAVIVDGKPMKEYPLVFGETVQFSPDGNRLAYVANITGADKTDRLVYVVDGQESKNYEIIVRGSFVFSPDSKRTCFIGVRSVTVSGTARQRFVVNLDGFEMRDYDGIRMLQFSPDSRHLAYLAQRDTAGLVVVDGSEIGTYDGLSYLEYSPDGSRLAYVATRGTQTMLVVDDKPGKAYAAIVPNNVHWNPDGKHIAYEALPPGEEAKPVIVVDAAESAPHNGTLRGTGIKWDSPTALHALIIREKGINRIEVNLPQ